MKFSYIKFNSVAVVLFVVNVLISFSCSTKHNKKNIDLSFPYEVKIPYKYYNNNIFNLVDYIDTVCYIKLETNENCLMGTIEKIQIDNDTIYLVDTRNTKSLYVFSKTGRFLYKISNIGKGSGQYIYPVDFAVINNYIIVYDDKLSKILYFNKKGEFLKEIYIKKFLGTTFTPLSDDNIAFYTVGVDKTAYELIITNIEGKVIEKHFEIEPWMKKALIKNNCFCNTNSSVFFIPSYQNLIYKFEGSSPTPYLKVNFEELDPTKNKITERSISSESSFIDLSDCARIFGYYPTNKFSILSFVYKNELYYALLRNPNKLISSGKSMALTKDMDYLPFNPYVSQNNKFISLIDAYSIKQMLKEKQYNGLYKKTNIYKQFGDSLLNIKNEDNPFVVFYTIKDLKQYEK